MSKSSTTTRQILRPTPGDGAAAGVHRADGSGRMALHVLFRKAVATDQRNRARQRSVPRIRTLRLTRYLESPGGVLAWPPGRPRPAARRREIDADLARIAPHRRDRMIERARRGASRAAVHAAQHEPQRRGRDPYPGAGVDAAASAFASARYLRPWPARSASRTRTSRSSTRCGTDRLWKLRKFESGRRAPGRPAGKPDSSDRRPRPCCRALLAHRHADGFEPRMGPPGTRLQAIQIGADVGAGQVQHLAAEAATPLICASVSAELLGPASHAPHTPPRDPGTAALNVGCSSWR